jgi:hypothetical protein
LFGLGNKYFPNNRWRDLPVVLKIFLNKSISRLVAAITTTLLQEGMLTQGNGLCPHHRRDQESLPLRNLE